MSADFDSNHSRRAFLGVAVLSSAAIPLSAVGGGAPSLERSTPGRKSFAVDANRVRLFSGAVNESLKVMVVADTHLFLDDSRGDPFQNFSGRMAGAYNRTKHFQNGIPTNPQQSFERTLTLARKGGVDLLAMVGDIFSFPSEAAIEWVHAKLKASGVLYCYIAGNHDWHYEGMEGSEAALRAEWTAKRLHPLYQGNQPLMASYDVKGVRFVMIDDSTYEILPEQLAFFREQVASGRPLVLLMHIPLYAPGRPVGFGCGHPDWGANTDKNWIVERRPKWPESGHSETTIAFRDEVFRAPNLLGVFAGHTHALSVDGIGGIPQVVTEANATGAYLNVDILPAAAGAAIG